MSIDWQDSFKGTKSFILPMPTHYAYNLSYFSGCVGPWTECLHGPSSPVAIQNTVFPHTSSPFPVLMLEVFC